MSNGARNSVPPGKLGLPYLGESLAVLHNPFDFLDVRRARHGDVFKSRLLGRTTVFLAGIEGAEAFYDDRNISRADAHAFPIVDLFGGVNMEMYDGPRHHALKSMALTAFDRGSLAGYLPGLQGLIEHRLAGWAEAGEFSATAELRKLAIEAICLNLLGFEPGPRTDAICRDYATVLKGFVSPPLALPATPYGRARQARDRLLTTIGATIVEHRRHPSDDGLSRLLAARADDGRAYTDDEAVLEVHHIVIAGFVVYALMAEVLRQLAEQPELARRCASEIRDHAETGPVTLEALRRLQLATRVVLETKRFVPLVPLAFGRAQRSFTCAGFRVREGWRVYLALHLCNTDPRLFRQPARFDPDRFGPERAEGDQHPLAFIPQGAGPPIGHQCLGLEYSTVLTLLFLTLVVRGYEWQLPAQDFTMRWNTLPPEPHDGLRVSLRTRSGGVA
jgi:cytochrome P450